MADKENAILGGDDRVKRGTDAGRESRSTADEQRTDQDGTAFSASDRRSAFRDEWMQNALPQPPEIPGYHLCWLSTTNSYDPIHKRMRMGYTPVEEHEIQGFESYKMKSGEFAGFVACNEMLLFKIQKEHYQEMMAYFHYDKPLEDEQMIRNNNEALQDPNAKSVASDQDDGFKSLGKPKHAPIFS